MAQQIIQTQYTGKVQGKYAWEDDDSESSLLSERQSRLHDESVISSYAWSDEGKTVSIYVHDEMLDMIDDQSISVLCDDKSHTSITVLFHDLPGAKCTRKLQLLNIYEPISHVSFRRKMGKNTVVVRLHKVDEMTDWPELCRAQGSAVLCNSESDEEEVADELEKQFDMQNILQGMGANSGMNNMEEMMRTMQSSMDIDSLSTAMDGAPMNETGESSGDLDMSAMMKSMGELGGNEGMEAFLKNMQNEMGKESDCLTSGCTDKIDEMLKTMQGFSDDDDDANQTVC